MKPAAFIRHVPRTLEEAVRILADVAPKDGRVLAGGQSLVPIMAFRLAKPAHLVDINEIEGLDRITNDGKFLSIGACARLAKRYLQDRFLPESAIDLLDEAAYKKQCDEEQH